MYIEFLPTTNRKPVTTYGKCDTSGFKCKAQDDRRTIYFRPSNILSIMLHRYTVYCALTLFALKCYQFNVSFFVLVVFFILLHILYRILREILIMIMINVRKHTTMILFVVNVPSLL